MRIQFNRQVGRMVAIGLAVACATQAHAQSTGSWVIKAGANRIAPQVDSGDLSAPSSPGSKVDIGANTQLIGSLTYYYSERCTVEGYFGLPYEHDVLGDGAMADVGRIGTVKQVSPTVFGQYRFLDSSRMVRPYVGIGLTIAHFYDIEGSGRLTAVTNPGGGVPTKLSLASRTKVALSPQLGIQLKLGDRWFADASVIKSFIRNRASLSTGQSVDVKLNPLSTNISIGYQFK